MTINDLYWVNHDRKKALRVIRLIQETQIEPFGGDVAGYGAKRIDGEHRLV